MSIFALSLSALTGIALTAFSFGVAQVLVVRLIALIYPESDPMRSEIIAEMAHVAGAKNIVERWHWLGETFVTAAWEGVPARRAARKAKIRPSRIGTIQMLARLDDGTSVRLTHIGPSEVLAADIVARLSAKELADRSVMETVAMPTPYLGPWQRLWARLRTGRNGSR